MLEQSVGLKELWPVMEEQLNSGKKVKFIPEGISMLPMLRPGVDAVVLKKQTGKLKKYDLPLYRRKNGQFVLHRVVGVRKNSYIMCGDNQYVLENGIDDTNILAVCDAFIKDGQEISADNKKYRAYAKKRVLKNTIRRNIVRLKRLIKIIIHKK